MAMSSATFSTYSESSKQLDSNTQTSMHNEELVDITLYTDQEVLEFFGGIETAATNLRNEIFKVFMEEDQTTDAIADLRAVGLWYALDAFIERDVEIENALPIASDYPLAKMEIHALRNRAIKILCPIPKDRLHL